MSHPSQHRFSRAAAGVFIAAAAATATITGIASPAFAHDELVGTTVETDTTGAANAVRLTFSNSIIEVGTEVVVNDASGANITDTLPEIVGPDVIVPLPTHLEPGDYSAAWRVVSSDGHPIEGAFTISVAADGSATIGAAETSDASQPNTGGADAGNTDAGEAETAGAPPVGALIAVGVSGVAVIAGGLTAASVGRKRRAQGMAADASRSDSETGDAGTA